jgi:hypothetical protein
MTNREAEGHGSMPARGKDETAAGRLTPRLAALRRRLSFDHGGIPWSDWLFWLFRVVAVLELLKGLWHWAFLLGAGSTAFLDMPTAFRAATVYFAVLDPVAAVGMWMTSSWGAVLWLVAAASQIALCLAFPETFGPQWPLVAIEVLAVVAYVGFTLRVAAGRDEM